MKDMGGGPAEEVLLFALPQKEPEDLIDKLRKKFPRFDVTYVEIPFSAQIEEVRSKIPADVWKRVTILVSLFTLPSDPASDCPDLGLVHLVSAGSNQIQKHPIYTDSDVTITTSSGIHGPQIAEWVVMTALVQSHRYNALHDLQKQHLWGKQPGGSSEFRQVRDMVGRRLGVLGYGSIGRQVGRVATAMGAHVLAYTATPKDSPEQRRDAGFIVPGTGDADGEVPVEWFSGLDKDSLHRFLAQDIDWLVVCVPLTDQTRHFLGKAEFDTLSQGGKRAVFVSNIARGQIIDQPALIEALKDGTLAGAALDVADPEPLPAESELWDLPNVTITPHISGLGVSYFERAFQVLELNLEKKQKGERLVNVVRRERGY